MAASEHKVFDLELVGVPMRKRRSWLHGVAALAGFVGGAMAMALASGGDSADPEPGARANRAGTDAERATRVAERAALQSRITSLDSEVRATRAELLRLRDEHNQLLRAYEQMKQARDRRAADLAAAARERLARRVPTPVAPAPATPAAPAASRPWAPALGDERSPPPMGPSAGAIASDAEATPSEARRIFVVPMPGIRLADVARLYDVPVQRLRMVNPEIAGDDAGFLAEGARVRIPSTGRR